MPKLFRKPSSSGFTLIELLVVIGVITILAAIVLVAVNPGRQFAQARDSQRRSDLYAITNAVYQFAAEHNGNMPDNFPSTSTCIGDTAPCYDLASDGDSGSDTIVPTYIADIPTDPSTGTAANTQYTIFENSDGRVVASATGEITTTISVTR